MRGKILGFDYQAGTGEISGDDGLRYQFQAKQWKASKNPLSGQVVDFEVIDSMASSIYVISGGTADVQQKRIVAAVLAFFLGGLGVHKFYLGKNTAGIIMLCCTLFGIILLFIPTIIVAIIAFIEFIIYLITSDDDFQARYIDGDKAWF